MTTEIKERELTLWTDNKWQNNDSKQSEVYSDLEWCGVRQELSLICDAKQLLNYQDIHRILWSLNVHYHVQKSPLLVSVLIKVNPVHSVKRHFVKNSVKYYPPTYTWNLQMFSLFKVLLPKLFTQVSSLPCMLYVPAIRSNFIWPSS